MFSHHPDGIVYVGDTEFPVDTFVTLEPGYALPKGMAGREYVREVRHTLYDANGNAHGGELPWPEGDRYLAGEAGYRTEIASTEPEISLEESKKLKTARINDLACGKLMQTDWQVIRHLGQKAAGIKTDLNDDQFRKLEADRQALRDLSGDLEKKVAKAKSAAKVEAIDLSSLTGKK